jgi:phosphopantetheinyl transferase (holo-ACP synthase)
MNISSRSTDPFLAALTNPTELARRKGNLSRSYPVVDKTGKHWADSEAAYKAFKTGDTPRDERVMVRIIAAKLQQHPELVAGIKERGAAAFLERCDHLVGVRGSRWEGRGRKSRFIRCLIAAFERVVAGR